MTMSPLLLLGCINQAFQEAKAGDNGHLAGADSSAVKRHFREPRSCVSLSKHHSKQH